MQSVLKLKAFLVSHLSLTFILWLNKNNYFPAASYLHVSISLSNIVKWGYVEVADVNAYPQVFLSLLATCLFHIGYVLSGKDGKKVFISRLALGGFDCAITRRFWRESSVLPFWFNKDTYRTSSHRQ